MILKEEEIQDFIFTMSIIGEVVKLRYRKIREVIEKGMTIVRDREMVGVHL